MNPEQLYICSTCIAYITFKNAGAIEDLDELEYRAHLVKVHRFSQ